MTILSLEVSGVDVILLLLKGDQHSYTVESLGKALSLSKNNDSIAGILAFQNLFSLKLQDLAPDLVVLCEGGNDSKKKRIRMEFVLLSACEALKLKYETYASSACTRIINSGFKTKTGMAFEEHYSSLKIPSYAKKAFAAGWRFLSEKK